MKKIFIALAAIATLAACSKSEVVYTPETEISFAPVASNRTKAMLTETEFPAEQFNVWAWYKPLPAGTTIAQWQNNTEANKAQQEYIVEKPFQQSTSAKLWSGVVPYYWPKVGSLLFAGYYPTTIADKVEYTFDATHNLMTISDYTPGMVTTADTYTEDLMYFNMTPTSYNSATQSSIDVTGSNVDVEFRHALSWINVVLVKHADTPDDATITVNSVKFTDILPTGDATVNNSPVSPATNEIAWVAEGTAGDIEVCPDDNTATTDVWENKVTLVKDNTTPLAKQPIFIPQTMTSKNLVVEYTVLSTDGSSFTEIKSMPLTAGADSWLPGKKYTYTISISTSEIYIDPAVTGWAPVEVTLPIE